MKKHILPGLLISMLIMVSAVFMPLCAAASEEESYSITIDFSCEDGGLSGASFKAYNAFDQSGELTGAFAEYDVDTNVFAADSLSELALTLSAYAQRDDIPADHAGVTDKNGRAVLNHIPEGIYLVVGEQATGYGAVYTPQPFIVSVPYTDENGETVTDIAAHVKYDRRLLDRPIELSAEKVWADNNDVSRPYEVTVQLLKDGEEYDSVILNEDNGWTHTWTELDASADWKVTEAEVPENYNVKISLEGNMYTITNTIADTDSGKDEKDPDIGSDSDSKGGTDGDSNETDDTLGAGTTAPGSSSDDSNTPSGSGSSDPSSGSGTGSSSGYSSSGSSTSDNTEKPFLPQTGQVKWPIPVMFISGAVLLLAGIVVTKLNEEG